MSIEEEIALKIKNSLKDLKSSNDLSENKIKCEYCGTVYDLKKTVRCPNCGASNYCKG